MWSRLTSIFRSSQPSSKTQSIPDIEMTTSINGKDIYENIINRLKRIGVEIPDVPKQNIFLSILNKIEDSKTTDPEKRRLKLLLQNYNDSFSNTQLERILYRNDDRYTEPDVMLPDNGSIFSLETMQKYFNKPIFDHERLLNLNTIDTPTPTKKTGSNYIDEMSSSLDRDFYDLKTEYNRKYSGGFYKHSRQPEYYQSPFDGNTYKDIMKSAEDYKKKKSILRDMKRVYNGYDQYKRVMFNQKTSRVHPTFLDPENYSKSSDDISRLMDQYLSTGQEMKEPDMMTSTLHIVSL